MSLSVSPEGNLAAGGTATVTITGGPAFSGVTVEIDNGVDQHDTLNVTLDENGNGSAEWNVPASGWNLARFNYGDASTVTRPIV